MESEPSYQAEQAQTNGVHLRESVGITPAFSNVCRVTLELSIKVTPMGQLIMCVSVCVCVCFVCCVCVCVCIY